MSDDRDLPSSGSDEELLHRCMDPDLGPEERERLEVLLRDSEEARETAALVRELVEALRSAPRPCAPEGFAARLGSRVEAELTAPDPQRPLRVLSWLWWAAPLAAAALVVVLVGPWASRHVAPADRAAAPAARPELAASRDESEEADAAPSLPQESSTPDLEAQGADDRPELVRDGGLLDSVSGHIEPLPVEIADAAVAALERSSLAKQDGVLELEGEEAQAEEQPKERYGASELPLQAKVREEFEGARDSAFERSRAGKWAGTEQSFSLGRGGGGGTGGEKSLLAAGEDSKSEDSVRTRTAQESRTLSLEARNDWLRSLAGASLPQADASVTGSPPVQTRSPAGAAAPRTQGPASPGPPSRERTDDRGSPFGGRGGPVGGGPSAPSVRTLRVALRSASPVDELSALLWESLDAPASEPSSEESNAAIRQSAEQKDRAAYLDSAAPSDREDEALRFEVELTKQELKDLLVRLALARSDLSSSAIWSSVPAPPASPGGPGSAKSEPRPGRGGSLPGAVGGGGGGGGAPAGAGSAEPRIRVVFDLRRGSMPPAKEGGGAPGSADEVPKDGEER